MLSLMMGSCRQTTFETEQELLAYVTDIDNGLTQLKTINGVDFTVTYRPTDLLVAQELPVNPKKVAIDSLRKKYSKYLYFNVSISKNNQEILSGMGHSRKDFGAMVNQLAFGMTDKVHLYSKAKDTIPMADYIYPRMYGMGKSTSMLFVYPRDKKLRDDDFFLTIEDLGLFTGEVGFTMPATLLKNEPKLKL